MLSPKGELLARALVSAFETLESTIDQVALSRRNKNIVSLACPARLARSGCTGPVGAARRSDWARRSTDGIDSNIQIVGNLELATVMTHFPLQHRTAETNGIRLHVAEMGEGPAVVLCHGFPETRYAWRHQLPALAAAGFRAPAPDMRGFGRSDRPVPAHTQLDIVGDMVGLLDALASARRWSSAMTWARARLGIRR